METEKQRKIETEKQRWKRQKETKTVTNRPRITFGKLWSVPVVLDMCVEK